MSLWLAEKGILTTPQAALAVMLSMSMVGSLAKLEVFSENMRQVKATVESLEAFLELPALPEPAQPAALSGTGVELKSVHFAYRADGPEVLHGIDLTLPQGSFTALVGPSGGGKSTVAKLIARFWDVTDGSITVGGTDVRAMPESGCPAAAAPPALPLLPALPPEALRFLPSPKPLLRRPPMRMRPLPHS